MSQQFISQSCSWFHRQENSAKALLLQKLTGIGLNRMGSISQCQSTPQLRYFMISYTIKSLPQTLYTGICYSANCTAQDLTFITKSLPIQKFAIFQPYKQSDLWNSYTIGVLVLVLTVVLVCLLGLGLQKLNWVRRSRIAEVVDIVSVTTNWKFMFGKSKNYQRMKIIAGLRALAFMGITVYCLSTMLLDMPTMPQPSSIHKAIKFTYYFNDLWLLISGFYIGLQLSKQWSKYQSIKKIIYTIIRHVLKPVVICSISILYVLTLVNAKNIGAYWNITVLSFQTNCGFWFVFADCNYWLSLFVVQMQMCVIVGLLYVLWQAKFTKNRITYAVINICILILSIVFATIFGNSQSQLYPQGTIHRCPIVSGICYLQGFNLGMLYFWFRTHRNKSKLFFVKCLKYKLVRILTTFVSLSIISLVIVYFVMDPFIHDNEMVHQLMLQLFRVFLPVLYGLLIAPEILGYENVWGALFKDWFMDIVSRLSFSSFANYYFVCLCVVNSLQEDIYVNFGKFISIWMATFAFSLIFGALMLLLIELPVYRALHNIFGRTSPKGYIQFY